MKNLILNTYFNPDNLKLAYYRIVCSPERLVKDKFGIRAFGSQLELNLTNLSKDICTGNYIPRGGFKYYEPKSSGTQRTKTILMIEDAIIYQAVANKIAADNYDRLAANENFVFGSVLMPETRLGTRLLEQDNPHFFFFKFWKSLYGKFRDSVIKAIEIDKATYKFETDITGFFDSIPHYNLLLSLSEYFKVEDEILDILSVCLNAWSGTKIRSTPGVGIPQGPQPSYFLANLLLHQLDTQLISEAFKYYRYMDDIKIYGYSESELRNVLVLIDNYLKSYGLSINSKKTGITSIQGNIEDITVKELKRIEIVGSDYTGDVESEILTELADSEFSDDIVKSLISLSNQSPGYLTDEDIHNKPEIISDQNEIIHYWENVIIEVESELPILFKEDSIELKDPENVDDIDFIRFSAKYGTALKSLSEYRQIHPSESLLPFWIFAIKRYYWRAGNYVLTLQFYKNNLRLKKELLDIFISENNYEWFKYHIITCLTYNFEFTDRELRDIYKYLKLENSDLVKYALYCMIIKHSKDPQLLSSLKNQLGLENSNYLKLITLDYWRHDKYRILTMDDLLKAVGL